MSTQPGPNCPPPRIFSRPLAAAWSAATGAVGRGQSEGASAPGVGVMTCTTRVRPRWGEDHALAGCRQRMCPSRSP
jgi:hypothetical protein